MHSPGTFCCIAFYLSEWKRNSKDVQAGHLRYRERGEVYECSWGVGLEGPVCNFQMDGRPDFLLPFDLRADCYIGTTQGYNTIAHIMRAMSAIKSATRADKHVLHRAMGNDKNGNPVHLNNEMMAQTIAQIQQLERLHTLEAIGGNNANARLESILTIESSFEPRAHPVRDHEGSSNSQSPIAPSYASRIVQAVCMWVDLTINHMLQHIAHPESQDGGSMYQSFEAAAVCEAKMQKSVALTNAVSLIAERMYAVQAEQPLDVCQEDQLAV